MQSSVKFQASHYMSLVWHPLFDKTKKSCLPISHTSTVRMRFFVCLKANDDAGNGPMRTLKGVNKSTNIC